MIRKFFLATFMFLAGISSSFADELFFSSKINNSNYFVVGVKGSEDKNPFCAIVNEWQDGSMIQFIKDLNDGEFYIHFKNNEWTITDPPNTKGMLRANFYRNRNLVGLDYNFVLLNKNTFFFITFLGPDPTMLMRVED